MQKKEGENMFVYIGGVLNPVVYHMSEVYDQGQISKYAFVELIRVCQRVEKMYGEWDQGVVASINGQYSGRIEPVYRCSSCLKLINDEVVECGFSNYIYEKVKDKYFFKGCSCIDCYKKYLRNLDYKRDFIKIGSYIDKNGDDRYNILTNVKHLSDKEIDI